VRNGNLQVGLVGAGGIGRDQHLPGWAKVPFAQVTAVADVSASALEQTGSQVNHARLFNDWHDLIALETIDVVDICTPNRTHTPIALAALAAGKHVLCEKPLATTSAEVRSLRDAARSANRLLMTGHHLRFDPVCQQLRALANGGMLGDIYYARAQWLRRRLLPPRVTFIEQRLSGGGAALDIGVHVLDLACWLMASPEPVRVTAQVGTMLGHRGDLSGSWGDWDRTRLDVEDFAVAMVRFANDAVLVLETSWLAFQPEKELVRLQCYGTRGGATWPEGILVGETNRVPWELRLTELPANSPHHEEILQFALAVRDNLPSPVPVEETLNVIRILEAMYRSGQEKREVTLT
jgi:predicted dehydrogenase